MTPIPAKIDSGLWYQYYFQTERGQVGLAADRRGVARMRPTFERPAMAFDNPDYVDVVIHSYRHGLGLAPGYPPYEEIERKQIGQRDRDRHLATQRGICRLELDHFDDLLVRHKLHKAAMVRVGVRSRFAGPGWRGVRKRDPERAALAGVERMHVAGHAARHLPLHDRARIEKRAINDRAGRVHARTLARAARRAMPHVPGVIAVAIGTNGTFGTDVHVTF